MASNGDIFLGPAGFEELISPYGRTLSVSDIELSRQERTINGTLRKEIINTKAKVTLDYSLTTGDELKRFISFYKLHTELSMILVDSIFEHDPGGTFSYDQTGILTFADAVTEYPQLLTVGFQIYTVIMQPIDRTRVLLTDDGLWSGVRVELVQV
jgi:hypothetical protein